MILHRLHNMYKMSMHVRKKQGQKAALLDRKYIVENYNKLKSELSHPSGVTLLKYPNLIYYKLTISLS